MPPACFHAKVHACVCERVNDHTHVHVEMGTRFGAHFLVCFFVQGVDREVA